MRVGQGPAIALRNTSESSTEEIDAFNRLNDPAAPHRVILLVNKGTEGWNCPSLFACALARRLRSSNNFVLQAATRCLRQVPGNMTKARIYLSTDNRTVLDRQLQETYGETIADLERATRQSGGARLILRKRDLPPVTLTRLVKTVVPVGLGSQALRLKRPERGAETPVLTKALLDIAARPGLRRVLQQVGETVQVDAVPETVDPYEAAVSLSAASRCDLWVIYDELLRLYPDREEIPAAHLDVLAAQIAEQAQRYEIREEKVEWALALVKPSGFTKADIDGAEAYTAEITYPKDKEHLLLHAGRVLRENRASFGFHYDPYNFDSTPELEFFQQMLRKLNVHPAEVEDIYFTGGLTDPAKTDFYVEYRGEDERWHRYTPDFVIRKRPRPGERPGTGRVMIVEIKAARFEAQTRDDERRFDRDEEPLTSEGRKAVALKKLEQLNPDRLKYELLFVDGGVAYDQLGEVRRFVREPDRAYEADLGTAQRLATAVLAADGSRVRKIILFGSRARGDAKPDSDFDLLVVVQGDSRGETTAFRMLLYQALRGNGVVAEPWVMSEEEFEETKTIIGGLAYPAWKEGVVLYERA